jgi:hypothetical protein
MLYAYNFINAKGASQTKKAAKNSEIKKLLVECFSSVPKALGFNPSTGEKKMYDEIHILHWWWLGI